MYQYLSLILKQTFCSNRYKAIKPVIKTVKKASTVSKTINASISPKTGYPE